MDCSLSILLLTVFRMLARRCRAETHASRRPLVAFGTSVFIGRERIQNRGYRQQSRIYKLAGFNVGTLFFRALRCAHAFGRVELFIFNSLTARMNPCPDT